MRRIVHSLINCFREARRGLWGYYRGLASIVFVVRVEGESAWPHLVSGKRYLASGLVVPRKGDWAVFRNPRNNEQIFVKRIEKVERSGYIVGGAVSWASSSDDFGPVPRHFILGKVFV